MKDSITNVAWLTRSRARHRSPVRSRTVERVTPLLFSNAACLAQFAAIWQTASLGSIDRMAKAFEASPRRSVPRPVCRSPRQYLRHRWKRAARPTTDVNSSRTCDHFMLPMIGISPPDVAVWTITHAGIDALVGRLARRTSATVTASWPRRRSSSTTGNGKFSLAYSRATLRLLVLADLPFELVPVRLDVGPGIHEVLARSVGYAHNRSASLLPSWRARSRSQTGIRVRAMQASPPHTPGVLSMPGNVPANWRATRWNSSALSPCDSDATCFSTSSNVLISSAFLSSGTANHPLIRNGTRHRRHGHRDGLTVGESKQPFNATRCGVPVAAAKFTDLIIPADPRLGNQGTSEAEPRQASRPSVSLPRGRGAVATEAVAGFGADGGGRRSAEVARTRLGRES